MNVHMLEVWKNSKGTQFLVVKQIKNYSFRGFIVLHCTNRKYQKIGTTKFIQGAKYFPYATISPIVIGNKNAVL